MKVRTGGKAPHVSASKLNGDECFYCLYFDVFTYVVNLHERPFGPQSRSRRNEKSVPSAGTRTTVVYLLASLFNG
jgi:hypothetical protein